MANINLEYINKLPKEIQNEIFDFIPLSIKSNLDRRYLREYIKTYKFKKQLTIEYLTKLIENNKFFIINEILQVYGNSFKQIINFYDIHGIRYKTLFHYLSKVQTNF